MKNTGKCPKCDSSDIIRIPGWRGSHGAGNNVPTGWFGAARVTRFLCGKCGFSEEWIESPDDIDDIRSKYGT